MHRSRTKAFGTEESVHKVAMLLRGAEDERSFAGTPPILVERVLGPFFNDKGRVEVVRVETPSYPSDFLVINGIRNAKVVEGDQ